MGAFSVLNTQHWADLSLWHSYRGHLSLIIVKTRQLWQTAYWKPLSAVTAITAQTKESINTFENRFLKVKWNKHRLRSVPDFQLQRPYPTETIWPRQLSHFATVSFLLELIPWNSSRFVRRRYLRTLFAFRKTMAFSEWVVCWATPNTWHHLWPFLLT